MNRQEFEEYIEQGGRKFVVVDATELSGIEEGDIVELKYDDESDVPAFFCPRRERQDGFSHNNEWCFIRLGRLKPFIQAQPIENHHYDTLHQPIETIQANMTPEAVRGYLRGNIIKYVCRMGRKDGNTEIKEAKKIQEYAKWLVESLEDKIINPREEGK